MKFEPRPYQREALDWIMARPASALFLDMGGGKTVVTLTAVDRWLYDEASVRRVLVVAPLRVARYTWPDEVTKWDHLSDLRVAVCCGTLKQRLAALASCAEVVVVNRENVTWLVSHCLSHGGWPFDGVVVDELTSFKSQGSRRFKALRRVLPWVTRFVGLTGTPAGRGLLGLWPQVYLIDRGKRLELTYGDYLRRYFVPGARSGYVVYSYAPKPGAEAAIYRAISDVCLSLPASRYLRDLPPLNEIDRPVALPDEVVRGYRRFEREQVMQIGEAQAITAATAAVLTGKLLQYGNGCVYDAGKVPHEVHTAKLDALEDLVEEAGGSPLLVFYSHRCDADRIRRRFAGLGPRGLDGPADLEAWNRGEVQMLLAHPASVGHGLNLQQGGHVCVWFGLTYDWELYAQACKRLHRPGQTSPVLCYRLIAKGTRDEAVAAALSRKEGCNAALLDGVRALLSSV